MLHEDRVDAAIALISATLGVGGALGLPISALITERSDWHVLFWVSAGLGAVVFALVLWIIPVSVLRSPGRFDFVGAAGLAVGLLGILLAISRGNEWGWGSTPVLALGLGGLVVLVLWGWFELRIAEPKPSSHAPIDANPWRKDHPTDVIPARPCANADDVTRRHTGSARPVGRVRSP